MSGAGTYYVKVEVFNLYSTQTNVIFTYSVQAPLIISLARRAVVPALRSPLPGPTSSPARPSGSAPSTATRAVRADDGHRGVGDLDPDHGHRAPLLLPATTTRSSPCPRRTAALPRRSPTTNPPTSSPTRSPSRTAEDHNGGRLRPPGQPRSVVPRDVVSKTLSRCIRSDRVVIGCLNRWILVEGLQNANKESDAVLQETDTRHNGK